MHHEKNDRNQGEVEAWAKAMATVCGIRVSAVGLTSE
jgi:hypothetical protein